MGSAPAASSQARTAAAFAQSEVNAQLAEEKSERAEANYESAREAVEEMTRLAEDKLGDVPQMQTARRALLEEALKFHQGFVQEKGDDPVVRYEAARAYRLMGKIRGLLGQTNDAAAACRHAASRRRAGRRRLSPTFRRTSIPP